MTSPRVRAALTAIVSYLPSGRLTNEMIAETTEDWTAEMILEKTGIRSRCVADDDEFTSDLAVRAAEKLFDRDPSYREDLDYLFLTTVSPDFITPCTGPIIQEKLGLPKTVGAFDVTLGCSGYTYGLTLAASMIESGRCRKILMLTADRFTACTEAASSGVRTIFGDGATANLIEAVPPGQDFTGGIIGASLVGTDGSGARKLITPTSGARGWVGAEKDEGQPAFEMVGSDVFNFTLKEIAPHIREFLVSQDLSIEDVSLFVFHQANLFMLEHLRRRLHISEEQFVVRIADVGNTVSSTIPLALQECLDQGRVKPGAKVLLCGFGVGYSWGSVLLEYPG